MFGCSRARIFGMALGASLVAATLTAGTQTAAFASTPVAPLPGVSAAAILPFSMFNQVSYDSAHQHVFVSGSQLVVADIHAKTVATVAGVSDSYGVAISEVHHEAFVAEPEQLRIAVVDTATLKVTATISTSAEGQIEWLAMANGVVWMFTSSGKLGYINPSALSPGVHVVATPALQGGYLSSAGESQKVLAVSGEGDPATVQLLAVSASNQLTQTGSRTSDYFAGDVVLSPNAQYVTPIILGDGYANRYRVSNEGEAGGFRFDNNDGPGDAGAYTGDGKYFVTGSGGVDVYPADSSQRISQVNLGEDQIAEHGLAASGAGSYIFAIVRTASGYELMVLPGPESASAPPVEKRLGIGFPLAIAGQAYLGSVVVDSAHKHVFVAGGAYASEIAVLNVAGVRTGFIPDMYGVTELVMSPNGAYLYAVLTTGDAVAVIDTATLTVKETLSTGTWANNQPSYNESPHTIALAAGRLWVDQAKFGSNVDLASVNANAPATTWTDSGVLTNQNVAVVGSTPATSVLDVYNDNTIAAIPQYTVTSAGKVASSMSTSVDQPQAITSADQILTVATFPLDPADGALQTPAGKVLVDYPGGQGQRLELSAADKYMASLTSPDPNEEHVRVSLFNEATGKLLGQSAILGESATALGISPDDSVIYAAGWADATWYTLYALNGPTSGKTLLQKTS